MIYEMGIRISLFIVYKIKMVTLPTLSSFDFLHSQWISQQFLIINKTTPRPAHKASPGCTEVYSSHQKDPRDLRFLSICGNFQSFLSLSSTHKDLTSLLWNSMPWCSKKNKPRLTLICSCQSHTPSGRRTLCRRCSRPVVVEVIFSKVKVVP